MTIIRNARGEIVEHHTVVSTSIVNGAGTELKKLLAAINITESNGCGCGQMVTRMNAHPPQWSRDNMDKILDTMADSARRQKRVFSRIGAGMIVRLAIRLEEKRIAQLAETAT